MIIMGKRKIFDTPDHWSDIVGMPDEADRKNIINLINHFKRERFSKDGVILTGAQLMRISITNARKNHEASLNIFDRTLKSKETELRVGTALPTPLWTKIEEAYPTMFRDRRHYEWFYNNFPQFKIVQDGKLFKERI